MQKIPSCKEGSNEWFLMKCCVCFVFLVTQHGYKGLLSIPSIQKLTVWQYGEITGRFMCKEECVKSVKWVQNNIIEDSGGRKRWHSVVYLLQIDGENTGDFFDTYAAAFIPDTETNRTVYISVCDDDLPEADETFTFYLTLPVSFNFSIYLFPRKQQVMWHKWIVFHKFQGNLMSLNPNR